MKGLKFPPVGKVTQSVISLNLEMQMRTKKLSWVMLDYTHIYICRVIPKKFSLQEKQLAEIPFCEKNDLVPVTAVDANG